MSLAFIFPGQGSQVVGMGSELARAFSSARTVWAEVDEALGQNLWRLVQEGPEDELTLTENAQPALMAASLAVIRVLDEEFSIGVEGAAFLAGHSLGDGRRWRRRGDHGRRRGAAAQAARPGDAAGVPVGEGAMASLIGPKTDLALAEQAAAEGAKVGVCVVANDNNPGNIVISGDRAGVDRAIEAPRRWARGPSR
jgi:[acyl-carrier-protein] S-malonyltransferase